MTARFGKAQKAAALVPLAALSAAWTISLTGLGAGSADASGSTTPPTLPGGTVLPAKAIEAPATISGPESGTNVSGSKAQQLIASADSSGIPAAALAAYQRAASVIDKADTGCHLGWQLLAAIGRIESDHGRSDGNTLSDKGIATPGIFGPVLNGSNATTAIADTDGGQFDHDTRYDRAVGPMQFIPSTWSVVGVDADGDGQRNPQDINDAALAAAVYLCSGTEDLATTAGQQAAVFRYNHSQSYVNTVLGIAAAYMAGDYSSVPNFTVPAPYFTPSGGGGAPVKARSKQHKNGSTTTKHATSTPATPAATPTSALPGTKPAATPSSKPTKTPVKKPVKVPTPALPSAAQPVVKVLSNAEALTLCSQQLAAIPDPLGLLKGVNQACADKVAGKTQSAALAAIPNTLNGILSWLGIGG